MKKTTGDGKTDEEFKVLKDKKKAKRTFEKKKRTELKKFK